MHTAEKSKMVIMHEMFPSESLPGAMVSTVHGQQHIGHTGPGAPAAFELRSRG